LDFHQIRLTRGADHKNPNRNDEDAPDDRRVHPAFSGGRAEDPRADQADHPGGGPQSVEKISYRIPTLTLNGRYLMYFAAYKNHVSLYPIPSGPDEFQKELKPYVKSKGTIPFPLDRPVPYDLVKKIAKLHVRGHTAGS
jgi:hypothetical protein